MIDVAKEKTTVGNLKNLCSDLSDYSVKLYTSASKVPSVFETNVATNEIENLLDTTKTYQDKVDNISTQISSLNGIIDEVYQEELREQQALNKENTPSTKKDVEETQEEVIEEPKEAQVEKKEESKNWNYNNGVMIIVNNR